jgi:IS5 family transposase
LVEIQGRLGERRRLLRSGTIVEATIIAAPRSTKNAAAAGDPELKQTRKGQRLLPGSPISLNCLSFCTDRRVELFGDQAYWKEDDRQLLESWEIRYRSKRRSTALRPLIERWRMINRVRARTRARGEHAFRVVKQL